MSEAGVLKNFNYEWDTVTNKWVKQVNAGTADDTYAQLLTSDDLVTTIQYHESDAIFGSNATISGITYSSSTLGTTAYETFASGTNTLVITRGL